MINCIDFVSINSSHIRGPISWTAGIGNVDVFQPHHSIFDHDIPVAEYLAETEAEMTKPETGQFLFDDLRELAASHAQQKLEIEKLIPESTSLGLFVVRFLWICWSEASLRGSTRRCVVDDSLFFVVTVAVAPDSLYCCQLGRKIVKAHARNFLFLV